MRVLFFGFLVCCAGAFAADSVTISRTGDEATIVIKINVADILAKQYVDKKQLVCERALKTLAESIKTGEKTSAEIDAESSAKKAAIDAEVKNMKAVRLNGSL